MAENDTTTPAVNVASKMDDESSDTDPPPPRENMISNAVRFLQNPKVRESPFAQRKAFLAKKGLTVQEIEIAVERSGTSHDATVGSTTSTMTPQSTTTGGAVVPVYTAPPATSPWAKWRDRTATAIVIGGISYALFQFLKKYVLPLWLGPSEEERRAQAVQARMEALETSMSAAVSNLDEMSKTFKEQQEQLRQIVLNTATSRGPAEMERMQHQQGVSEIKTEIQSLKGLLLSRKQFPPTPRPTPVIPAWQLGSGLPSGTDTKSAKTVDSKSCEALDDSLSSETSIKTNVGDLAEATATAEQTPTGAGPPPATATATAATAAIIQAAQDEEKSDDDTEVNVGQRPTSVSVETAPGAHHETGSSIKPDPQLDTS